MFGVSCVGHTDALRSKLALIVIWWPRLIRYPRYTRNVGFGDNENMLGGSFGPVFYFVCRRQSPEPHYRAVQVSAEQIIPSLLRGEIKH